MEKIPFDIRQVFLKLPEGKKFEVHLFHRDTFIILEGEAAFEYGSPWEPIGVWDKTKDIIKADVNVENASSVIVREGEIISFEPGEAHKPLLPAGTSQVKFILIKESV